jgi:predicted lipoprotein with Yx(FWY)xxD motif
MFRFLVIAATILLSAQTILAHAHGSESTEPPPPKQDTPAVPVRAIIIKNRPMLVDLKGMTLYYFERDDSGDKSTCDGKCTESWIPVTASANAQASGDFTVITRSDGSKMWANRYRPLYRSHADKAPGDTNGADDPSNLWHVAPAVLSRPMAQ